MEGEKKEGSPSPVSNLHRRPQPLSLEFELKVISPPSFASSGWRVPAAGGGILGIDAGGRSGGFEIPFLFPGGGGGGIKSCVDPGKEKREGPFRALNSQEFHLFRLPRRIQNKAFCVSTLFLCRLNNSLEPFCPRPFYKEAPQRFSLKKQFLKHAISQSHSHRKRPFKKRE